MECKPINPQKHSLLRCVFSLIDFITYIDKVITYLGHTCSLFSIVKTF